MTIYALCDITHISLLPWQGKELVAIDVQRTDISDGVTHIVEDIRNIDRESLFKQYGTPELIIAFPPCTHLCASGARHWRRKGQAAIDEAMSIVNACIDIIGEVPAIMENPIGRLSTLYRKSDAIVDPYQFADRIEDPSKDWYEKKTCLWTFNGARLPAINYDAIRLISSRIGAPKAFQEMARFAAKDSYERSITPKGLAIAIMESNK